MNFEAFHFPQPTRSIDLAGTQKSSKAMIAYLCQKIEENSSENNLRPGFLVEFKGV